MISNDVLIIKYPKGKMSIYLPEFFPASQGKVKKLFKCGIEAMIWDERSTVVNEILAWLMSRHDSVYVEEQRLKYASMSASFEAKLHALSEEKARQTAKVENLKYYAKQLDKSGKDKFKAEKLEPAQKELKSLKEQISYLKKEMKESRENFCQLETAQRGLEANITLIKELMKEHRYGSGR